MSIIKTESGWVELGAGNPLERAFETAGFRASSDGLVMAVSISANHARCSHNVRIPMYGERAMKDTSWTLEQIRAWNVALAGHVGVNVCIMPCRQGDGDVMTHAHKTDVRTLPAGVALFGKYGPEWVI